MKRLAISRKSELTNKYNERMILSVWRLFMSLRNSIEQPTIKSLICEFSDHSIARVQSEPDPVFIVHIIIQIDSQNGTEKHISIIDKGFFFQEQGCCLMTEMSHGSNLARLETAGTYDHSTREFVLNSPTATSTKRWIGALTKTAKRAVVFARLLIRKNNKGMHVSVIRIQDMNHQMLQGLKIGDCGHKVSLNSVDNGYVKFINHRVQYDSLLNRHAFISLEANKSHRKKTMRNVQVSKFQG